MGLGLTALLDGPRGECAVLLVCLRLKLRSNFLICPAWFVCSGGSVGLLVRTCPSRRAGDAGSRVNKNPLYRCPGKVVVSGIHEAILGREWLTLCLYKIQLVLYVKSQNCAGRFGIVWLDRKTKTYVPLVRYSWPLTTILLGTSALAKHP